MERTRYQRPTDLTWWERVQWAMRDDFTNQCWAELRAIRNGQVR